MSGKDGEAIAEGGYAWEALRTFLHFPPVGDAGSRKRADPRSAAAEGLAALVNAATRGDIRDVTFDAPDVAQALKGFFLSAYAADRETRLFHSRSQLRDVRVFFRCVLRLPEFDEAVGTRTFFFSRKVASGCLRCLCSRSPHSGRQSGWDVRSDEPSIEEDRDDEINFMGEFLFRCYKYQHVRDRSFLRTHMGAILQRLASKPSRGGALAGSKVLQVVAKAIRGFKTPLGPEHDRLIMKILLPLHAVDGKISHTEPLISLFYSSLMECLIEFVKLDARGYAGKILRHILIHWPAPSAGNSPKEILLMRGVSTILETIETVRDKTGNAGEKNAGQILDRAEIELLSRRIASSLSSENSQVCQAALKMWSEDRVSSFFFSHAQEVLPLVTTPLLEKCCSHWNHTVRRMSGLVLREWLSRAPEALLLATILRGKRREDILELADELVERESAGSPAHGKKTSSSGASKVIDAPPQITSGSLSVLDVVFGKELGTGSFGTVKHAYKIVRGEPRSRWPQLAIKQIDKRHADVANREAKVMSALCHEGGVARRHPGLVLLVAPPFYSRSHVLLAMEYCARGDLHTQIVRQAERLSKRTAAFMTLEIMSGLSWLHEKGFVYSDLKPENILIDSTGRLKLCDFGAARKLSETERGMPMEGTAIYMAPEILRGSASLSFAADLWSLGCVVHFMLSSRVPAGLGPSLDIDEVAHRVVRWAGENNAEDCEEHVGGSFPSYFDRDARSFCAGLLKLDPRERLTLQQCQSHPLLQRASPPLPGMDEIYEHEPPRLPRQREKPSSETGEWAKRSFSLLVAPLPGKFSFQRGADTDEPNTILECDEERAISWIPSRQQLVRGMPAINEQVAAFTETASEGKNNGSLNSARPVVPRFSGVPRVGASSGARLLGRRPPMARTAHPGTRSRGNYGAASKQRNRYLVKGLDLTAG